MENTINSEPVNSSKISLSLKVDPEIHAAISKLADDEDRPSLSNMGERLLKTHPQIQAALAEAVHA